MRKTLLAISALVLAAGCSSSDNSPGTGAQDDAGPQSDAGADSSHKPDSSYALDSAPEASPEASTDATEPERDSALEADAPGEPCQSEQKLCVDHATRRYCAGSGSQRHWEEQSCGAGQGCVRGECVTGACSDECTAGQSAAGKSCKLLDMRTGAYSEPDAQGRTHDRARAYIQWLRRDGQAHGGVGNAYYADPPTYSHVQSLGGLGDSAIWTGSYLAAEALRLQNTEASDARTHVKELVNTLHTWFNVSGDPGVLVRYAAPSGPHPVSLPELDCGAQEVHCAVPYKGTNYDYIGHISRDQYQGVMLGYALAYEALGEQDEATRALIREDVVELVKELMKERTVPMRLVWNGTPLPQLDVTLRFVVLARSEMDGNVISLNINSSDYNDTSMWGFQEFMPNLADVVHQYPGLSWVPNIPRASSAIMLASFFRVALLVTDGVPGYQDTFDEIETYYETHAGPGGNIYDWISVGTQWSYDNACGDKYYANNISMEPMYNWARLESDPARRGIIQNSILNERLWPEFEATKNSFFSFIYAANFPSTPAAVTSDAAAQLSGFPAPPRIRRAVDLRNDPRYQPHDPSCTDQVQHSAAVDVADRVVEDFQWQRHPWGLYDQGDVAQSYPGVDYLIAYWLGRRHGFLTDDTASQCLVWQTP